MKKERGITLLSLVITIVLMLIIAGSTVYTSVDRFKINNVKKLLNDIDQLNDKVNTYYLQYGSLPIVKNEQNQAISYTFSSLTFNKNVNDNENYQILDLKAMGDFTLNYGKEGYEHPNTSDDVYIINEKTHTIYYVKGVEGRDGTIYHTKGIETTEIQDTVPPTKPIINIVEGDKIEKAEETESEEPTIDQYETNVTLEFIPGKDNVAGISRTTYSINDSEEQDINTLENHQYKITQNGTFEITVKTYNNNNISSVITKTVKVGTLPAGYTQVEYLESTGNQWIDTGLKGGLDHLGIDFKFNVNNNKSYYILGNFNQVGQCGVMRKTTDNIDVILCYYVNNNVNRVSIGSINTDIVFSNKNGNIISNNKTKGTIPNNTSQLTNSNLCIYGTGTGSKFDASGKVYYLKVYNDLTHTNLIMDLVPCLDNNGVPCMYDTVSKQPFYNSGTGTFRTNLDEQN